ncbi:MAG: tetratricopeptide repeat protein [Candidatus Krumholzibacteriota bacterium]|nr:tetratricopeptide repeat protein [Candidatus Krumholzibacteriota bacterium]
MAALILSGSSCGKKSLLQRVEDEYRKGNFRECVFLVRHHFRRGGSRSPRLLFISGKALLKLGIEADAGSNFAEIYSADTTWAVEIAGALREEALICLDKGLLPKGKRLMFQAINYQRELDFGTYNELAGELLLERKDFERAAFYFNAYLETFPDTAGAASAMMNLGAAYEGMGKPLKAIELYRTFQERYPKSRLRSTANWRLENLMLNAGEQLYSGGEPDEARNLLLDLAATADNPLVRERANFLLGQICEGNYDIEKAIYYYREVVNLNLGSSGRLVDKAKERIEKLDKDRLRH